MSAKPLPVVRVETGFGHIYETPDGNPVPGVTSILGKAVPKPALVPWAAKETAGYTVDNWDTLAKLAPSQRIETIKKEWRGVRDRAAVKGTRVHAYAEAMVHGQGVDVPPELMPYVEPAARFLDEWQVRAAYVEAVVFSDEPRYAGTLDLIADLADGRRWLLDWKTSRSGIFPETQLQLTAYRWADWLVVDDKPLPMPDVDKSAAVWLPGDGRYELIPVETGAHMYPPFEACCRLAAWAGRKRSDLVGRHQPPPPQTLPLEEASA